MSLQGKLTLGSVLLATLVVGVISLVNLINDMQRQFEATLERAELLRRFAFRMVAQTLERQPTASLREALRDPALASSLVDIMAASTALLEVAVVSMDNEILADSDSDRLGITLTPYPPFEPVVKKAGPLRKLEVLRERQYYQLEQTLTIVSGDQQLPGDPQLRVRVIIDPALIRNDISPSLNSNLQLALITIIAAVSITFLFSTIAFRPLGKLGHMLDLVARGEFEPEKLPTAKPARDEVSVIASKVTLLGERLRGAQSEVSDLRGNFDRLLQDLEDAVVIFNRDRRAVFASGAVEKFLGKSPEELTGQSLIDIFPPSATLGLLIAQAAQTGRPIRNRRVPVTPPGDGARGIAVVLLSAESLETLPGAPNAGAGLLVRLRDPEATRKIGRELQIADRLAAISRITGGVAHEVKNPLNAILLHVEVARAKLAQGNSDIAPQMEIISREILRLDRVVKTFLDFTRPVELNVSLVPLQEFVREVADLAAPQADASGIRVIVREEAEGVEVRVDRDLMKQAIFNIVVNAIEAMPGGGELRFESFVNDDTAEIRISDSGPGIRPDLREKIFRLYFTTKETGTGIGLAMTFRIVQLHDGTIDFTSEPGKGTAFSVRLPTAT
jgi:signal transduction histidine kinase